MENQLMKPTIVNAQAIKEQAIVTLQEEVKIITEVLGKKPKLTIVKATDDKACEAYIRNKIKLGKEIGIEVEVIEFDESVTQEDLVNLLVKESFIPTTHGLILQQPMYNHIDVEVLLDLIPQKIDADCFTSLNLGLLMQGKPIVTPCTPQGVIDLLDSFNTEYEGSKITVIGRSRHVGLPLSTMLTQRGAIVTTTHSKSLNLENDVRDADIVVSCVGKEGLIKSWWMKKDSILIGVGISYIDGKQQTDYDIQDMVNHSNCLYIGDRINCTGTMTVLNLIKNTITLAKKSIGLGGR